MGSATTDRRMGLAGNTAFKTPAAALAIGNIVLSGEQSVGGVAVKAVNGAGIPDRVLCVGQTDATTNGLWDVSTGPWSRSIDADGNYDWAQGTQVIVTQGAYAFQIWNLTSANPITVGTTALAFSPSVNAGNMAALAASSGSSIVGFIQTGLGAVPRFLQDKDREVLSITDFYANGVSGVAVDPTGSVVSHLGAQAAVNICPSGGMVFIPTGRFKFAAAVTINKPITIRGSGPGSFVNDLGSYVIQSTAGANAFTLVATIASYAFGQYGIINVNFNDLAIIGANSLNRLGYGIAADTTVNGGVFHIRECKFTNVNARYFYSGIFLNGIAYLNDFFSGTYSWNVIGVTIAQGTSGTPGGQTRFFGTTFDLNSYCGLSFLEDTFSGDLSVFGCTFADTQYGLRVNQDTTLVVSGCHFEACNNSGTGAGIYLPVSNNANPNSGSAKSIIGNNFTSNDRSIWVNKTSTGFTGGSFAQAVRIDCNYFGDANAIYCTVPGGHAAIDSQQFVIGPSNSGPTGPLTASQITGFMGIREANRRVTRRYNIPSTWTSGNYVDDLPAGMVLQTVRTYLTTNATGFTQFKLVDQLGAIYLAFDASTQALNTWVNGTVSTLGKVTDSTNNRLQLVGTAGWNGTVAVIEIDGYVP